MSRVFNRLGFTAVALVAGALPAMAQGTQTANATIDIVDSTGAPVAGVTVRLTSPSLQGVRTGISDAAGRYSARLLPPGKYSIEIVKEGLQTVKLSQTIGVDQNFQPRVVMQKTAAAVVEVIAAASPAVDKSDVKTATNFSADRIDTLPSGRTMDAMALLAPGVTQGVGNRTQVRGAMTSGNLYLLDGQNVADNTYNNLGVQLINDTIEETQVITGAISAEYGNVEGGVINSITKSGSNTFSGMLRWDETNPAWNALGPLQPRTTNDNKLSDFRTFTLGGYILKDRLWFFTSYYNTNSTGVGSISGNAASGPGAAGSTFSTTLSEIRRLYKLTYLINQDQTVVLTYGNLQNAQGNRNYSAGELLALVPQTNTQEYWSVAWRSVWSSAFTSELRFGGKKQKLSAGATDPNTSPIYDDTTGFFYNNGIFNSGDGGDNRTNQTVNWKGSAFFNAAGEHQLDFGVDYYKGTRKARNDQSVTGMIVEAGASNPFSVTNRTADGVALWTFQSSTGSAGETTDGLYVNDKWTVNNHAALQLGVRWDKYSASRDDGSTSASATGLSPRLGLNYDLFGDQKWILKASYSRYNAPVLEAITNAVTNQGNPTEIDYAYIGPAGAQPLSVLYNLANYDRSAAGVVYYNNPALNVRLDPNMKAPTVDEYQLSATYSFNNPVVGNGYIGTTAVWKDWKNLLDYTIGNNGQIADPTGAQYYITSWGNSPVAKRKYRDLELILDTTKNGFHLNGNITWANLEGNYEGEGTNTPGRGEGLQRYTNVNGVPMYDSSITAPYGKLLGDMPLSMRWTGDYTFESAYGRTTLGLIYRFNSGLHYSDTRTVYRQSINPALPATFGTTATQYRDGERGQYVYPGTSNLDLAITQDFDLFLVGQTPVRGFVKFLATNFLNHQQVISFNTVSSTLPKYVPGTTPPNSVYSPLDSAWVRSSNYGSLTSSNYGLPRQITLSTGIRF
ncbi:MAG: carboxypeptidase regulatory-like domain-containing protein [Geothrix sp.]|nr:carboxypeptidase regulatory-like domain-containing protein [Geothrix sp.]